MMELNVLEGDAGAEWEIDLDHEIERLLKARMGRYSFRVARGVASYPFGPISRWPETARCKVRGPMLHDCAQVFSTPCHLVSDRFQSLLAREVGHQMQFLPISLVTHRGEPIAATYWLANPLLKITCETAANNGDDGMRWVASIVPTNARAFISDRSFPELNVDDALGTLINKRQFLGVKCYKWRSRTRIARGLAIPDPVIPTVTFTKVRKGGGPSKGQQRREATAAFAREHAMPRLAKLIEQDFVRLGTPATPAAVREIEKALGVRLPADYAKIIQTTGTFTIDGEEILANSKGASHPVVQLTREFRKQRAFKWPDTAVCIYDDGRGGCSFLDTARLASGTCPVVSFDHELVRADGTPRFEAGAPSFAKFVERLARTAMQ